VFDKFVQSWISCFTKILKKTRTGFTGDTGKNKGGLRSRVIFIACFFLLKNDIFYMGVTACPIWQK
jgi:hypothetical protein